MGVSTSSQPNQPNQTPQNISKNGQIKQNIPQQNNSNPLAQLFKFSNNNGVSSQQQCSNYLNGIRNWCNIALVVMIVLLVLFLICIFAHIKYSSCDYENESKHNPGVTILNVIFWIFIAIVFMMAIVSIINWVFLKTWLDNANNQATFMNQCETIYNNWNTNETPLNPPQ